MEQMSQAACSNVIKERQTGAQLSSKELTEEQMQVLRREASFNTADAKPAKMIAAVESMLSQTGATDETMNLIRHQVSSLLMAHRPYNVLSKVERNAIKELRADNDLVIVPADKGRSTVVYDRTDNNQKAKSLLEDRHSYVPCEPIPIKTLTSEINATLLAMENSGAISSVDRRMAKAQETALARFYGLPKVHKEGALRSTEQSTNRPKFWARCVDVPFVVIERYQVLKLKEHLNAVFPDIQFTMEDEEKNQLAFLDVLVCLARGDNRVSRELPESCLAFIMATNQPMSELELIRQQMNKRTDEVGK
ncbi:hypothetical protein SprV_0702319800 [Sparganum proliferum]